MSSCLCCLCSHIEYSTSDKRNQSPLSLDLEAEVRTFYLYTTLQALKQIHVLYRIRTQQNRKYLEFRSVEVQVRNTGITKFKIKLVQFESWDNEGLKKISMHR